MARSKPGSRSIARRPSSRSSRSCIWVFCEGFTERTYFEALARFFRDNGIKATPIECRVLGRDPLSIVQTAVEARDNGVGRGSIMPHDHVWCLVDRDEHHTFEDALRYAGRKEIDIAVSTPCFELWLLLHFGDQRAYLTAKQAERAVRRHLPRYAKKVEPDFPLDAHPAAADRARSTLSTGAFGGNPSTSVWRLLDVITETRRQARR
ncbi:MULTISPECIES: RloB family protein [Actinoalloteichus]|uniref:RloB-like protein n=1 Tax=Actinoalloteichus fjordicus TaxID=1612552 RepID=A0AAC9LIM5_9PSEU|nr:MULTISPECIES: RloB family protein [Actinoalloteichus]APU17550.1 RloB-like protein [Actinoalloteichus fjordicus]APU23628.1 RloB-like protein [Actinoalloteichus sp. GBA129-24]